MKLNVLHVNANVTAENACDWPDTQWLQIWNNSAESLKEHDQCLNSKLLSSRTDFLLTQFMNAFFESIQTCVGSDN